MAVIDTKNAYLGSYLKVLDAARHIKDTDPAGYPFVVKVAEELREYTILMTETTDLPEVPKP